MAKNKNNQAIWGTRIKDNTSNLFQKIGSSISIDKRLYKEDIAVSIAHVEMLFKQKMEEIEADVVPFGVINTHDDNGPSEEDLELYRERERWQIWNPDEDDKPINF